MPEIADPQKEMLRERYVSKGSHAETEIWQALMRIEELTAVPVAEIVAWMGQRPAKPRLWDVKARTDGRSLGVTDHWVSAISAVEAVFAVEAVLYPTDPLRGVEQVGSTDFITPRGAYHVTEGGL